MNTIKTISNISYNTDAFFNKTVNDLVDRGVIDWCYWIRHKADADELKDHIHFVLKPSKRVDTTALRLMFNELDSNNPSKPLSCTSKWNTVNSLDDWLLYAVHDSSYLASKGQMRNYHYDFNSLCATDEDALRADWNVIDRTKFNRLDILMDAVMDNVPFVNLVQNGLIPIAQRAQYQFQYNDLVNLIHGSNSNRKQSHEEVY